MRKAKVDLFQYLVNNFKQGQPIILKDLVVPGMSKTAVRQTLKRFTDEGKVQRCIPGVYYIFCFEYSKFNKRLFMTKIYLGNVLGERFMGTDDDPQGYWSGQKLENFLCITTQHPFIWEVTTNNTKTKKRFAQYGPEKYIIRKAKIPVTKDNVNMLMFFDLLKRNDFSKLDWDEMWCLKQFMKCTGITKKKAIDFAAENIDKIPVSALKNLIKAKFGRGRPPIFY
jgi:predicted transcriptional regulator of viral defense system